MELPNLWKLCLEVEITTKKSTGVLGIREIQITDNWVFVRAAHKVTAIPKEFIESISWSEPK